MTWSPSSTLSNSWLNSVMWETLMDMKSNYSITCGITLFQKCNSTSSVSKESFRGICVLFSVQLKTSSLTKCVHTLVVSKQGNNLVFSSMRCSSLMMRMKSGRSISFMNSSSRTNNNEVNKSKEIPWSRILITHKNLSSDQVSIPSQIS